VKLSRRSLLLGSLSYAGLTAAPSVAHACKCVSEGRRPPFEAYVAVASLVALVEVVDVRPSAAKQDKDSDSADVATVQVVRAGRGAYNGELLRIWSGSPAACEGMLGQESLGTRAILIRNPNSLRSMSRAGLMLNVCADDWLAVNEGWVARPRFDSRVPPMRVNEFFARYGEARQ